MNPVGSKRRELNALCERHRVEHLALFGSALRDDFDPGKSDLDFSVEFSPMSSKEHAAAYFGLLEDLEGLFGRRVEIHAVRNPYLRRSIEEETVYAVAGKPTCGTSRTCAGPSWSSYKDAASPITRRIGCSGGRSSGNLRW